MKLIRHVMTILLFLVSLVTFSHQNISDDEKGQVIDNIKALIDGNYVFDDKVEYINNSLDSGKLTGKYQEIKDYETFANALTKELVNITKDLHFKVQYNPEFIASRRHQLRQQADDAHQQDSRQNEENQIDWNLWYAKKENFGFEKLEILGGNIGYIKFNFWHHLEWAKETIDASMKFVANTDALIIDLSDNGGGYSPTDTYLASYFFDQTPILWMSSYERRSGESETSFTFSEIGGERYLNKPVFILVSENTFSLAESFAYSMKHFNKAVIIGQASAGAAHAIDFLEINDNFMIQLPIRRSIHPITQRDWEGTGVLPNIEKQSSEALKTAHLIALNEQIDSLKQKTVVGPILKRYEQVKMEIESR